MALMQGWGLFPTPFGWLTSISAGGTKHYMHLQDKGPMDTYLQGAKNRPVWLKVSSPVPFCNLCLPPNQLCRVNVSEIEKVVQERKSVFCQDSARLLSSCTVFLCRGSVSEHSTGAFSLFPRDSPSGKPGTLRLRETTEHADPDAHARPERRHVRRPLRELQSTMHPANDEVGAPPTLGPGMPSAGS